MRPKPLDYRLELLGSYYIGKINVMHVFRA